MSSPLEPEISPGPLLADMIARLAIARKVAPANRHPGVMWLELRHGYTIAVNGHGESVQAESPGLMGWLVEPYTMVVFFNGWMQFEIRPYGEGDQVQERIILMGQGEASNETTLRAALEEALKEVGAWN